MTIASIAAIERRLAKIETRRRPPKGVHCYTDTELADLIAWLKNPAPADEAWAVDLFCREGLLP